MIAGVDPGISAGGWAVLDENGKFYTAGRWEEWQRILLHLDDISHAVIEAVSPWGSDSKAQSFSRSKLFENFGFWSGLFAGHNIKVSSVYPRTWKAYYKLNLSPGDLKSIGRTKGDDLKATMSLDMARRLWPRAFLRYKKDNGIADALLLAEWGRQKGISP